MKPILVVGAGPVGLTAALGLHFYGLPFQLFEEDAGLSSDTKAGTILTRTLEAFRRYGVADRVLAKALRVDEIGDAVAAERLQRARQDRAGLCITRKLRVFLEQLERQAVEMQAERGSKSDRPRADDKDRFHSSSTE